MTTTLARHARIALPAALFLACLLGAGCASPGGGGDSIRLAQTDGMVIATDTEGRRFDCTGPGDYEAFSRGVTDALFGRRSSDVADIGRSAGYACTPRT